MSDFDDLLAKAEAATPGPWEPWDSLYIGMKAAIVAPGFDPLVTIAEVRTNYDDAKFLAAASPDVIRALVLRLRELDRLFDLRWKADMRAINRWRNAAPADLDRSLTMPDRADLGVFLLERLRAAEDVIQAFADTGSRRAAAYFTAHDTTEGGE